MQEGPLMLDPPSDLLKYCEWSSGSAGKVVIYDDYSRLSVVWASPALLDFWGCENVLELRERQRTNYKDASSPLKIHFSSTQRSVYENRLSIKPTLWTLTLKGQLIRVLASFSPLMLEDNDGRELCLVRCEFSEVTERGGSSMRDVAAFRFSSSPVFLCKLTGELLVANFAADSFLGGFMGPSRKPLLQELMDAGGFSFQELRDDLMKALSVVSIGNSSSYRFEQVMFIPDENELSHRGRWWLFLVVPTVDPDVGGHMLLVTLVNVTTQKELEVTEQKALFDLKLRKESQLVVETCYNDLTRIIDTAHAPIFSIDNEGLVCEWNCMSENIIGVSKKLAVGRPVLDLVDMSDDRKQNVALVLCMALQGTPTSNFDFIFNGNTVHILFSIVPRKDDQGNVLGAVAVGQDITQILVTQRKLAKVEQLRVAESARATAERELSEFLLHEIRNPLASLDIALKAIISVRPNEMSYEADVAIQCINYIKQILSNVLDLGKIREGTFSMQNTLLSTSELFSRCLDMLKLSAQKGVSMNSLVLAGAESFVGDSSRLIHVIVNLVSNACKNTTNGSILLMASREGNSSIRIEVRDTGSGITDEAMKTLFSKPYATPSINGSGLGLLLVTKIVFIAGGHLRVHSRNEINGEITSLEVRPHEDIIDKSPCSEGTWPPPNTTGSCLAIVFPEAVAQAVQYPETVNLLMSAADIHKTWKQKSRVLVLDDQLLVRKMFVNLIKRQLVPADWDIDEAEDFIAGLPLLLEQHYDIIVCDQHMSTICKGSEVIPEIRNYQPNCVIIGTSGNDCLREMLQAGADLFWRKPWAQSSVLLQEIHHVMLRKQIL